MLFQPLACGIFVVEPKLTRTGSKQVLLALLKAVTGAQASMLLVAMGTKGKEDGEGHTVVPLAPLDKLVPSLEMGSWAPDNSGHPIWSVEYHPQTGSNAQRQYRCIEENTHIMQNRKKGKSL